MIERFLKISAFALTVSLSTIANASAFDYEIDAAMTYIDMARSSKQTIEPSLNRMTAPAVLESNRTLGLKHFRLVGRWEDGERAEFMFVLRPDALQHGDSEELQREFDSRAGETRRPQPSVKLLDAYEVALLFTRDTRVGIGVYERMESLWSEYDPKLLMFGLSVLLPEKYSAFRVQVRSSPPQEPLAPSGVAKNWFAELIAYQGRNDRAESLDENARSGDQSVAAQDPYVGGAMRVEWVQSSQLRVGGLVGRGTEGLEQGHINETFAQVGASTQMPFLIWTLQSSFDARYSVESWENTEAQLPTLTQVSLAFTNRLYSSATRSLLLGLHYGTGMWHAEKEPETAISSRGLQGDIGYEVLLAPGLRFSGLINHESRAQGAEGENDGAFGPGHRRTLQRFAVGIAYDRIGRS